MFKKEVEKIVPQNYQMIKIRLQSLNIKEDHLYKILKKDAWFITKVGTIGKGIIDLKI
jgi:hypothetical protein